MSDLWYVLSGPVGAAEYDFGYETPSEFLELAMVFENTDVGAEVTVPVRELSRTRS